MPEGRPLSIRSAVVAILTRDTLVLLYYAVVVTEALLYTLPAMDPGTLTEFGASPFEIPFVATAAAAGFYGLKRIQEREERLFWAHLAFACVFWVLTLVAITVAPASQWGVQEEVLTDAAYLFFYSPILFAAECKPYVPDLGVKREAERRLRWAGVTLLVLGWFFYFIVSPVVVDPGHFSAITSASLLFITLDVMIVVRFAWRAYSCGSVRWRALYGALAAAGVALLGVDGLDLLGGIGLFALPDGAITDLLWAIPPFFLLMAFRLREADLPRLVEPAARERTASSGLDPVRVGSFLVGGALSFPMVHFALHTWSDFDPRLLRGQRIVVFAAMAGLGALALNAFVSLERQRVEAERRRAAREERIRRARTLEAVSRLAAVVAEEYGASIRAIGGFVDRAVDTLGSSHPLREEALRAAEQVQRAADFTGNFAAISRQARGRPIRLDLAEAVSDRMGELRHVLGAAIELEHVPSREPSATMIDPMHLRTVLLDLLAHARDAMPRGGRCRVETGVTMVDADAAAGLTVQPGRYARLLVRDTGPGIAPEILPHIFEPFVSTAPGGQPGSGLGLATCHALVSQAGGCVTVTSEPGDTAFEVLLPSPRG